MNSLAEEARSIPGGRVRSFHLPDERGSSICSVFTSVAAQFARATALMCDGVEISYADLDRLSTRISLQLRHAGLQRGELVGLIAHRSIEATAAILGILKAGGVYLPLDISYPPELLRYICRDSGISLTLVAQALLETVDLKISGLEKSVLSLFLKA